MSNVIATVKLNPGQGGYYDELSRIHLTPGNPIADVLAGTNCTQLRKSVQSGRLRLLSGSFGPAPSPFKLIRQGEQYVLAPNTDDVVSVDIKPAITPEPKVEEVKEEVKAETVEEAPVVEETPAVEEAPAETDAEEVAAEAEEKTEPEAAEEPVVEEKPKKATRKTRAKKSKEA